MKINICLAILIMLVPISGHPLPLRDGIYDPSPVSNLTGEIMLCDEPLVYSPTSLKKECREDLVQREEERQEEEIEQPVKDRADDKNGDQK